jgi:hypothetical protein
MDLLTEWIETLRDAMEDVQDSEGQLKEYMDNAHLALHSVFANARKKLARREEVLLAMLERHASDKRSALETQRERLQRALWRCSTAQDYISQAISNVPGDHMIALSSLLRRHITVRLSLECIRTH